MSHAEPRPCFRISRRANPSQAGTRSVHPRHSRRPTSAKPIAYVCGWRGKVMRLNQLKELGAPGLDFETWEARSSTWRVWLSSAPTPPLSSTSKSWASLRRGDAARMLRCSRPHPPRHHGVAVVFRGALRWRGSYGSVPSCRLKNSDLIDPANPWTRPATPFGPHGWIPRIEGDYSICWGCFGASRRCWRACS